MNGFLISLMGMRLPLTLPPAEETISSKDSGLALSRPCRTRSFDFGESP